MAPQTRYARSGDVSIAYQVFGDGPFDVVVSLPASSHVELAWEAPMMRATGARVAAHAGAGEVLVSSTVRDLVAGSGLEFVDRGVHELKGVPGEWRLYAAV
jgi:hypothetical protein